MTLTHCGRATHTCVSDLNIIGSDNGLSPGRGQALIWTNAGILLIEHFGIYFSESLTKIQTFWFKKMHLKMSSAKCRLFRLGLNVLNCGDLPNDEYRKNRAGQVNMGRRRSIASLQIGVSFVENLHFGLACWNNIKLSYTEQPTSRLYTVKKPALSLGHG